MVFRPDIQGLRGISVLAVLFFHLGVGLPGGFVGVDVFFVISGFLMTGLIAEEFDRRATLSFGQFYSRRIRRIFPALLVMIVVTTGLGYFLLFPGDYKELAQSGLYAALSLGNVFFYFSSGYFDIPSESKGLLHTWSLGVEEQFYLIWPLIMLGLLSVAKGRRTTMAWLMAGIVGAGFLVSVYGVLTNPKAAFYLLHARLWELAAGGFLVFAPRVRVRWRDELFPAAGLALDPLVGLLSFPRMAVPGLECVTGRGRGRLHRQSGQCAVFGRPHAVLPAAAVRGQDLLFTLPVALASHRLLAPVPQRRGADARRRRHRGRRRVADRFCFLAMGRAAVSKAAFRQGDLAVRPRRCRRGGGRDARCRARKWVSRARHREDGGAEQPQDDVGLELPLCAGAFQCRLRGRRRLADRRRPGRHLGRQPRRASSAFARSRRARERAFDRALWRLSAHFPRRRTEALHTGEPRIRYLMRAARPLSRRAAVVA